MLVVLGAVGFARFAFGMILPGMAVDLGLSYRHQGILGASYFLGYLAVVALMPWLAPKIGPKRLCVGGLAVVTTGLLAMAMGRAYSHLAGSYFVVGLGSGAAFIGAKSLPVLWFHSSHRARGAGVVTAGAGVGILVSGLLVPHVRAGDTLASWQLMWLGFAAMTALFCVAAAALLRNRPADLGVTAYGRDIDRTGRADGELDEPVRMWSFVLHIGTVYALFAATALTYATFIVTTMVDSLSVSKESAGLLWAGVGGLSIFSGHLFGYVSDRFGHRAGMVSALGVQAMAYGLIASGGSSWALYLSVVLFGLSAWSMPAIVAAAAGDYLGPERAARGFAVLTLMFATGQVLGPAGAGFLADWTGGFAISYGIAAGINVVALTLCMFLRPPPRT
jgi:MFS family permease